MFKILNNSFKCDLHILKLLCQLLSTYICQCLIFQSYPINFSVVVQE